MHIIKVCTGCACERNYGNEVLKRAEKLLGIKVGETTEDGQFRLEKTGCLSHCDQAPNVLFGKQASPLTIIMNDGEVKHRLLPNKLEKEINKLKETL